MFSPWFILKFLMLAALITLRAGGSTNFLCDCETLFDIHRVVVVSRSMADMDTLLSICAKSFVQLYECCGLKLYQGQKSIVDIQHNMDAVLYHNEVCTNGQPRSEMAAQVSLMMKNDQGAHPHRLQRKTSNESVP
jgi:hypothetical protein